MQPDRVQLMDARLAAKTRITIRAPRVSALSPACCSTFATDLHSTACTALAAALHSPEQYQFDRQLKQQIESSPPALPPAVGAFKQCAQAFRRWLSATTTAQAACTAEATSTFKARAAGANQGSTFGRW